ncbi:OLC1v1020028C1 [Oldenlandia corymbosa var. corymbosa]|uniref:OLC1v1020028C1 n=1 Tax=Oldenlandia corymbosa var. corymbosa TaxID=529605 RepID=A0AAV1EFN5_OLDCO|nr:OLC1v1020028C1 [Oldenlandia corymbosa var. corymbosa]
MAAVAGISLNHVSRESSDVKRLAKFYTEVFGFEQVESPKFGFEVIWLKLPGNPSLFLHLIERDPSTKLPEGPWSASSPVADPKNLPRGHHVCFSVPNFDAFIETLKEKGIQMHQTTQPDGKTKQAFFFDPDGNGLEMSQEQPRRDQEPIKYGDVFQVSGELAEKPIAPQDASMMQTAESRVLGHTQKGGPAAAMQSAATINERAGLVSHDDVTDFAGERGVSVTETDLPGTRIITESVAGQVVGQIVQPTPVANQSSAGSGIGYPDIQTGYAASAAGITIGQALEAAAQTAGDKPVEQSDAAAIQAAEVRATGTNVVAPGGIAATAQAAASYNESQPLLKDEDKVKIGHVLTGATEKLASDKVATREDAEGVVGAELRNNPELATHPGGVAASVAAAARLNERQTS